MLLQSSGANVYAPIAISTPSPTLLLSLSHNGYFLFFELEAHKQLIEN